MPYKDKNSEVAKQCQRNSSRRWFLKNKEKHYTYQRFHKPNYYRKLRFQVCTAYGNRCACCGETAPEFLTVDHINGGGTEHRRKRGNSIYLDIIREGFPKDKYRLLCMNCNWARSVYGKCPHECTDK